MVGADYPVDFAVRVRRQNFAHGIDGIADAASADLHFGNRMREVGGLERERKHREPVARARRNHRSFKRRLPRGHKHDSVEPQLPIRRPRKPDVHRMHGVETSPEYPEPDFCAGIGFF